MESHRVYHAAVKGDLASLKDILDHKPKYEVEKLVSAFTHESTPLIGACERGHTHVVKYLLKECKADVEQFAKGIINQHEEIFDDATPLWCAAKCGHLPIVELLVKHKASVNSTKTARSNALRAACASGNLNIVKYLVEQGADVELSNWDGYTCLMEACSRGNYRILKYLLDCGADVNRTSKYGTTALHECSTSGNLKILQALVRHGAQIKKDKDGVTPLSLAAAQGFGSMVMYLFEEYCCSKQEKINAFDLFGTVWVGKGYFNQSLRYWKRLRYEDSEFQTEKPTKKTRIEIYLNRSEIRSLDQLQLLIDPEEIIMQAFSIRERILGPHHPVVLLFLKHMSQYYLRIGCYDKCTMLLIYVLGIEIRNRCAAPIKRIFRQLAHLLSSQDYPKGVLFRDVCRVFQRAKLELELIILRELKHKLCNALFTHVHLIQNIILMLLCLMCKMRFSLNQREELMVTYAAQHFLSIGQNKIPFHLPLHLACSNYLPDGSDLQSQRIKVVELLIEIGASPNVLDRRKNTTLHIAAGNRPFDKHIFHMLLKKGAHLDFSNIDNKTALNLVPDTVFLDITPLQYLSLQCLCAKTIKKHKINYNNLLHKDLCRFVDLHNSH